MKERASQLTGVPNPFTASFHCSKRIKELKQKPPWCTVSVSRDSSDMEERSDCKTRIFSQCGSYYCGKSL